MSHFTLPAAQPPGTVWKAQPSGTSMVKSVPLVDLHWCFAAIAPVERARTSARAREIRFKAVANFLLSMRFLLPVEHTLEVEGTLGIR